MSKPPYDVLLFGATSFVGQLVARYLSDEAASREGPHENPEQGLSWAMAGRSRTKLEDTKKKLGSNAQDVPLVIADAQDSDSLLAMCKQAKVIISTVGPYSLYGNKLIEACVGTGTDYCDLTGEVHWIREMVQRYQSQAQKSGARIVNCCGFDSVPSDLGVYFLQKEAHKKFNAYASKVEMRVRRLKGGVSGGTVASIVEVAKQAVKDPSLRKVLANPHALCVGEGAQGPGQRVEQYEPESAALDPNYDRWIAPFIMAGINTRVVHRSNGLHGLYGKDFVYNEGMLTGKGLKGQLKARGLSMGLKALMAGVAVAPTRKLLEKFVLPSPGQGPSEQAQREGLYELWFRGEVGPGQVIEAKVSGDEDPGYLSTSKMLCEAALCLLHDIPSDEVRGGFWTPATALGADYLTRLQAFAGLEFELR